MDANRDEASIIGSLAARHNERHRAFRFQRCGEALVQGDLYSVGNEVPDLGVQDLRTLDQGDDIVGESATGW
jgi:hypothetical protein